MEIKVVIVDDSVFNADSIEESVGSYISSYHNENIKYVVTKVCKGIHAYSIALEYIKSNQHEIDILLVDYDLIRGLGTDLFKHITTGFRIYKVMHSETDLSFVKAKDGHKTLYDVYSYSKEDKAIHKDLKQYETDILNIKLYGNKQFQSRYFINDWRLSAEASKPIRGLDIRPFEIIYVQSLGNEKFIIYFTDLANGRIDCRKSSEVTINYFQTGDFEKFAFKRINKQTIVNLLWVSNIDLSHSEIEFIQSDNYITFKKKFEFSNLFYVEVLPYLSDINMVPAFFRR